mmetsp:Transcript_16808/g.39647  ORF Transcript_16808/g.39647 Transcript_16808/m.39647 type:complete len:161 (+) Transcript_16808:69-551(+)
MELLMANFDEHVQLIVGSNEIVDEGHGCHTVFEIEVRTKTFRSVLFRRYSEFLRLHKQLRKAYPSVKLPRLPPKRVFSFFPDVIERRGHDLQVYLEQVLRIVALRNSPQFTSFLMLEEPLFPDLSFRRTRPPPCMTDSDGNDAISIISTDSELEMSYLRT